MKHVAAIILVAICMMVVTNRAIASCNADNLTGADAEGKRFMKAKKWIEARADFIVAVIIAQECLDADQRGGQPRAYILLQQALDNYGAGNAALNDSSNARRVPQARYNFDQATSELGEGLGIGYDDESTEKSALGLLVLIRGETKSLSIPSPVTQSHLPPHPTPKPTPHARPKIISSQNEYPDPTASATPDANSLFINRVNPSYPAIAQEEEVQGQVTLEIKLDANGSLVSEMISKSSGSDDLDKSALAAARASTYKQGHAGWYFVTYTFNLDQ